MCSSLASPDSETTAVLIAHGASGDLTRLEEMKISNNLFLHLPPHLARHRYPT